MALGRNGAQTLSDRHREIGHRRFQAVSVLFSAGDRFAEFVIRMPLGLGGSSEVYPADDGQGPVALKIIRDIDPADC